MTGEDQANHFTLAFLLSTSEQRVLVESTPHLLLIDAMEEARNGIQQNSKTSDKQQVTQDCICERSLFDPAKAFFCSLQQLAWQPKQTDSFLEEDHWGGAYSKAVFLLHSFFICLPLAAEHWFQMPNHVKTERACRRGPCDQRALSEIRA